MKLNRDQIVKALECHIKNEKEGTCKYCTNCPASEYDLCEGVTTDDCVDEMFTATLALIRELSEENERLRKLSEEGTLGTTYSAMPNVDQRAQIKELLEGAECPTCHGTGKIGTTNWLTKHLSEEQIAKEKAEAVAEFHRELRADTVRKMQERFNQVFGGMDATNALLRRTFGQIAKELLEEGSDND